MSSLAAPCVWIFRCYSISTKITALGEHWKPGNWIP